MANTKISALTSATTPLAGTEVLPIVQSSTTVKVATDDLTVKNIRSNATTGILQIAGPAAASTRIATVPNANWTAARTDAAQSFTGDQTFSTGNIIQGTAAKGINFTANTPAAGMTTQLLNWYEEGTWTPTVTFATPGDLAVTYNTNQRQGIYTRTGNRVVVNFLVGTSAFTYTTSSGVLQITGLPFTAKTDVGIQNIGSVIWGGITKVGYTQVTPTIQQAANYIQFVASGSAVVQSNVVSTDVPSGGTVVLRGMVIYEV